MTSYIQDIHNLDHDAKSMVVQWNSSLVGQNCGDSSRIVNINNIDTLWPKWWTTKDKAIIDANIEVYPGSMVEGPEPYNQNFIDSKSLDQDSLRSIVRWHKDNSVPGRQMWSAYIWKNVPQVSFRMQPCSFITSDILGQMKTLIDQFVSEGVLISDTSYSHASPQVIIHSKNYGCLHTFGVTL